jgi:hypothetical protein
LRLRFKTTGWISDHPRGIHGIYFKLLKKFQKTTTCNQLGLKPLGFDRFVPQNLPQSPDPSGYRQLPPWSVDFGEILLRGVRNFPWAFLASDQEEILICNAPKNVLFGVLDARVVRIQSPIG